MIGPHEGKELELMLAGVKPLAAFSDLIPASGAPISEEIIPEKAFAAAVSKKLVSKHIREFSTRHPHEHYRCVCYTLPHQEWRAEALMWIRQQTLQGLMPSDTAVDIMLGRLLGYSEADIQLFINV